MGQCSSQVGVILVLHKSGGVDLRGNLVLPYANKVWSSGVPGLLKRVTEMKGALVTYRPWRVLPGDQLTF